MRRRNVDVADFEFHWSSEHGDGKNALLFGNLRILNSSGKAGTHPMNQEVQTIAKEALDTIIGNNAYQHLTTNQWSQQAVETITTNLVKLNKPYKYIVTCVIMQTNAGAGLSVSSTCYWDKTTDQSFTVRWENKSVVTIVNVFAVAI
ncbi:Dynein light chain Tctex-type 1 [Toxocara canis]|uniref:Dynein light chain Tctex-type 1 n=1 Tax=Toxocara canis TaxID=6265 RepID=A0A0B2UIV9_TOXCA|nr:Dynein light chain Tctex-type 1 [Toxocara canis]